VTRRARDALALLALVACEGEARDSTPPPPREVPPPLAASFADATARAGVDFAHTTGAFGAKLLPETMGSGVAVLDFDGDGALDLFFVDSTWFDGHRPDADALARCRLFRGLGDGRFEDATEPSGAGLELYGMGASSADYDGDGDDDLYVTALGDNVLLRNDGGRFADATASAGVAGGRWRDRSGSEHAEWSTASAWLDADGDGDLDLFVGNYCQWSERHEIFTTLDGVSKAFTTPDRYVGTPCRVFENRGDGTFADATDASGVGAHPGKALGIALWDVDGDGRLDVLVANDTRPNFLFFNRSKPGALAFEERGVESGFAYDADGRARAGMGIDAALLPGGALAVAIGNFADEALSLYQWDGAGPFADRAEARGIARATRVPLAFGLAYFDADLDGWLDLAVANGHIEPDIARFDPDHEHAQAALLFRGLADGSFEDVSALAGADFGAPRVGRGLAVADFDGDGDLDLALTQNGGRAVILANELQQREPRHWLRVVLRGRAPNTRAIGATVELRAGDEVQTRLVRTGSSYLSQSDVAPTFGLGAHPRPVDLRVRWPSGRESSHSIADVDRTVEIGEP
jgi:hypothetical protein